MTAGCTIASASYAAYVRVLAARWRDVHPSVPLCVLFIDEEPSTLELTGIRVIRGKELGLSPVELEIRRGIYNPWELATSLKADLLRALLAEGHDAVLYVDPDTGIYASVADVAEAAVAHGIALTPHLVRAPPRDGLYPSELEILEFGVFNGGLLAVGRTASPFLEWWADRLRRDCLDERNGGLHADQTWLQAVPQYFEHTVLRDPTLHVAHWNVHERNVEFVGGRYLVEGKPLRTFHFSQFDPDRPDLLSTWVDPARYRVDPARNPAVFQLLRDYAAELMDAGNRESRALAYAYALGNWERAVYREAVLAAEARGTAPPPSPFDPARAPDFDRLVGDPSSLRALSEPAQERLERLKPLSGSLPARVGRRLRRPVNRALPTRVTSDVVLAEYA